MSSHITKSGRVHLLACLLAVALSVMALAACGDGGGSEATETRATTETTDPPARGFHDTSGVTDIPAFGGDASAAELEEAQQVLVVYLGALQAKDWNRACAHLDTTTAAQLRQLLSKVRRIAHKTCGEAVRLLLADPPTGQIPYLGPAQLSALRLKRGEAAGEGAGFALFHGKDGNDYWITMRLEGGQWKVTALAPQRL